MKKSYALIALLFGVVSALFLFGCQSKEVTSAKVYIQQNDWDKAIEQLEQAVKLYPSDPEAHFLLGQGYAEKKRWAEMNKEFDASLAAAPTFQQQITSVREKNWVDVFNDGVKKVNSSNITGAITSFETCLVINPKRMEAYQNLAYAFTKNEDLEKATQTYQNWLANDPANVTAMKALGAIYFDQKEFDKALEVYQKVLSQTPEDVDAIAYIAMLYDNKGESDKAVEYYQKALEKRPEDTDLIFNLGRYFYMKSEYGKAIEEFRKVIQLSPDDFDANVNVGNALLSIGQNKYKDLKKYEDAGKDIPAAGLDEMKGYFQEAVSFLEKAVTLKPEDANAWYNLGVAYINSGETEKGKEAFDKSDQLKQQ